MTSKKHEARCRALRGGCTESEAAIIADLAACEKERDEWYSESATNHDKYHRAMLRAESAEKERDALKEQIACASTPLMADVLRERDEMRQGRENYLDSAKDAEARALAAEAALKRVRNVAKGFERLTHEVMMNTIEVTIYRLAANRILAAILEETK